MVEKDFIPLEKMLEILEDIKDMGVQAITFSGGGELLPIDILARQLKSSLSMIYLLQV